LSFHCKRKLGLFFLWLRNIDPSLEHWMSCIWALHWAGSRWQVGFNGDDLVEWKSGLLSYKERACGRGKEMMTKYLRDTWWEEVTYCLPYIRLPKTSFIFTLKMETVMLAEAMDNSQHSTRLILESRSCTLNSSIENLKDKYKDHWRFNITSAYVNIPLLLSMWDAVLFVGWDLTELFERTFEECSEFKIQWFPSRNVGHSIPLTYQSVKRMARTAGLEIK
jgi:hypothetical protein